MQAIFEHTNKMLDVSFKKRSYSWSMQGFHYHDSYEIYILTEGTRTTLLENKIYELTKGDVLFFPPKTFHKTTGTAEHERVNIEFTSEFLDSCFTSFVKKGLTRCFENNYLHIPEDRLEGFLSMVRQLDIEYSAGGMYYVTFANILKFLCDPSLQTSSKYISVKRPLSRASRKLEPVISYISENYSDINSIDDIASHCYINKSYLCRLFKREIGSTVMKYLSAVRVQQACELLAATDMSLTEIGMQCGFGSSAYFCCVFKDIMGCTPSDFRKHQREIKNNI